MHLAHGCNIRHGIQCNDYDTLAELDSNTKEQGVCNITTDCNLLLCIQARIAFWFTPAGNYYLRGELLSAIVLEKQVGKYLPYPPNIQNMNMIQTNICIGKYLKIQLLESPCSFVGDKICHIIDTCTIHTCIQCHLCNPLLLLSRQCHLCNTCNAN